MSSPGSVKSLRTPLGIVRGLGAAGHGFQHWWGQRLTSIALVPLSLWFAFSVASLHGGYPAVKAWLSGPCSAALALLTVAVVFQHVIQGVAVIVEDYVQDEKAKLVTLLALRFLLTFMAVASLVSVLKIALGG